MHEFLCKRGRMTGCLSDLSAVLLYIFYIFQDGIK